MINKIFFSIAFLVFTSLFKTYSQTDTVTILFNNGVEHFRKNDYPNAISCFTKALDISPNEINSLYNRGIAYFKSGDTILACKDWVQAQSFGDKGAIEIAHLYCEDGRGYKENADTSVKLLVTNDSVYTTSDVLPQFLGGEERLFQFLSRTVNYPIEARLDQVSGKVYVGFVITSEGYITQLKILKGLGSGFDKEVIRVIKSMPKWIPGIQDSKPVSVNFYLPVSFKAVTAR